MELVTGFTGEPHITPEQDADLYRGVIGIDSYVLPVGRQLEHEVETVNKIVVNDGVLMLQGREMSIEAGHQDEYTIENGIQGENRIDLIGIRYTVDPDTGKESVSHETIKGESVAGNPTDPTFTTGDIRGEGAIDVFFPLYSVRLTGLTISAVVKRFSVTKSVTDLEEYIDTQKGRIDTLNARLPEPINYKKMITNINELNNYNKLADAGIYGLNGVKLESNVNRWGYVYVLAYGNFTVQIAVFVGAMYIRDYAGNPASWSQWSAFEGAPDVFVQSGETEMTPSVANQVVSKRINFDKPYKTIPTVVVNAKSAAPQNVFVCAGDISLTGFTIYLHRNSTTLTGLCWMANGK